MFFVYLSLLITFTFSIFASSKDIVIEGVTKDGIYLNIGTKDGVVEFSELYAKPNIKIKILKLSENHSIGCLVAKDGGCDYNIEKMLKIKDMKFSLKTVVVVGGDIVSTHDSNGNNDLNNKNNKDEKFVRNDSEKFRKITQKEVDFFSNNNKVFDLIIFNEKLKKRDVDYQIYGSLSLYNIAEIELLETDFNYLNHILQGDLAYEDDNQKFNFIFDANLFLQKEYSDFSASIYQLSYAIKYNKFSFKIGRDNLSDLNDFYLTDGFFANYENKNLKFGMITAFGIDYYNEMKTDFKHIYIGAYGKVKFSFNDNIKYSALLGFVPEIFDGSLGVLPIYLNNSFNYKKNIDFNYMFKMSYSQLDTKKDLYFNNYLTLNLRPIDDLNIRLGFDSREYLDLINYSYYETILEKIDSDKTKNASFNISYKFNRDLLSFSYKRRIIKGGANEYTGRYFTYYFSPVEASFRITSLLMEDVDIFIGNLNLSYNFSDDFKITGDLFVMLEKPKIINEIPTPGITPQLILYKKFFSYFYLRGSMQFELRSKKIAGMLKIGYIFNNLIW